ncbi:Central kinetochore-associated [Penicillium taxi]|uniref:Central kinetochore-associated n=1 Tax=Penicillium taxi TaxID=168475 RepID=UPI002545779F|nr:Central kinetochore-associated [Penicillium taxi]KAJ5902411.1 Central kinetochore-associated [Penicillium taxi]
MRPNSNFDLFLTQEALILRLSNTTSVTFKMSNPLSPLSTSFQNTRALSPKTASSPFLPKTIDDTSDRGLSSPLKRAWTEDDTQAPYIYEDEENNPPEDFENDDDFHEAASSPFQENARDNTVDFQKLQEYQELTPKRSIFGMRQAEDPMSSPFRPDARDETIDLQKLRELQPLSPGLSKRLAVENPDSSPFRPDAKDETVDLAMLREMQAESPDFEQQLEAESSPFRPEESSPFRPTEEEEPVEFPGLHVSQRSTGSTEQSSPVARNSPIRQDFSEKSIEIKKRRSSLSLTEGLSITTPHKRSFEQAPEEKEEPIEFPKLRGSQRSTGSGEQSSSVARNSPICQDFHKDNIEVHKRRSMQRSSLGLNEGRSIATPRKRSFEQTPQDLDDMHEHERSKKGLKSSAGAPEIHIDLDEESILHDQSFVSSKATYDQSTISSMIDDKRNEGMSTVLQDDDDGNDSMDDTGFSNFSVLPDMTSFAKLRADSPLKPMRSSVHISTPNTSRNSHRPTLLDAGSPVGSPTPRHQASSQKGKPNQTPNLLDFTDEMNFYPRHSMQQGSQYSPSRQSPMRHMRNSRSPTKLSLLDFDIPPQPSPRSLPSITPRELESLKSSFMSEVSSLKATLSGKEAEVASLKKAVGDAERRVGEALEELRNEAALKQALEIEQATWDRRGQDMERVLKSVRDELEEGESERDRLTRKAEDLEKSKENLEGRVVELETQLSTARTASENTSASGSQQTSQSAEDTTREVQEAVERVARELHTLYKSKHETKVAALKKSYESRWEKRLREVEKKLSTSNEENERLRVKCDSAGSNAMATANASMMALDHDEQEAEKHVLEAQIKGLQHEMAALKEDSEKLRADLKAERTEKGELVAAVDEWLAIQQTQPAPEQNPENEREPSVSSAGQPDEENQSASEPPAENFHRSISRGSGIRPPSTVEKRKPRYGAPAGRGHSRGNSGSKSGIAVFTPGRGGIMSSIERMGRGGA